VDKRDAASKNASREEGEKNGKIRLQNENRSGVKGGRARHLGEVRGP